LLRQTILQEKTYEDFSQTEKKLYFRNKALLACAVSLVIYMLALLLYLGKKFVEEKGEEKVKQEKEKR
jgi:hypothetical protein